MKLTLLLRGSLLALLPATGLAPDEKQPSCSSSTSVAAVTEKNIVETALAAGQFNTLATALKTAGLVISDDEVRIGGARIVKTDIHCSNGVIHVIDRVLLPE